MGLVLTLLLLRWLIPETVHTVTMERQEVIETLVTTGRVRSVSRSALGAPLMGTVARVEVREGDRVAAGDVLVALEEAELQSAVDEARARVASAEAALRRVITVDLPAAAAALEAAELEARQLNVDEDRLQELFVAGGLSQQELEVAQRTAQAAAARLESARGTVAGLSPGGADRSAAQAAVAQASQAADVARARLEQSRIRAPAAGTVLIREVEPGDVVQPGQMLIEIAIDGPTELVAFPDERSVANLREGQPALASADAYPDQRFEAAVARIAPVVDPMQGTIEVRLTVPSPPEYLIPDMTVSVNVELVRRPDVPTLPLEVVRAPLTDSAWVLVVQEGRATRTPVEIGVRGNRVLEILSGVEEGESVIAEPADAVSAGARVRARARRGGGV